MSHYYGTWPRNIIRESLFTAKYTASVRAKKRRKPRNHGKPMETRQPYFGNLSLADVKVEDCEDFHFMRHRRITPKFTV